MIFITAKPNTALTTLIAMIIAGLGVGANARPANQCMQLFDYVTSPAAAHSEGRSNHSETNPETRFEFIPENVRLTRRSKTEFFVDYIFRVNDDPRLKTTEVAMDYNGVIDANLQSGREFLNSILNNKRHDKPNGAFVFIDVNNLGWMNKNFQDKMQAGDLYIFKTIDAIQQVVGEKGLVFRLGGDEFGIVLEIKSPEEVQKIMQDLQREIHAKAHSLFLKETKRRVTEFRLIRQKRQSDEISEAEYQIALQEFRTYTSYSQEGVSMGAAYIDASSPAAIQSRAEKMAVEMKIKIKIAFNLDTAKYTGGINLSNSTNRIKPAFRPDIPTIMSRADFKQVYPWAFKSDTLRVQDRSVWFSTAPMMQLNRMHEVFRLGQLGIGKYKNELKATEYRLEYYNINEENITQTRPIEVNTNTGFMDARSQGAKILINHFLESVSKPDVNNGTIWVSLLNLGKLNYFHRKTETGDIALGLAARAIEKELVGNHVPFKYNGSDFLILTTGMSKQQINDYKKVLEEKLNSNTLVDQIFLQEIEHIERTEIDLNLRKTKIDEIRKLMAQKYKVF
ncbi:MAG: diguanylate cyclase [Bdellovibrionota bacterium]